MRVSICLQSVYFFTYHRRILHSPQGNYLQIIHAKRPVNLACSVNHAQLPHSNRQTQITKTFKTSYPIYPVNLPITTRHKKQTSETNIRNKHQKPTKKTAPPLFAYRKKDDSAFFQPIRHVCVTNKLAAKMMLRRV